MATNNFQKLLAGLVMVSALQCISFSGVHADGADTSTVYRICNGEQASLTFTIHLSDVLGKLIANTPNMGYDYYYSEYDTYGHAVCNGKLAESDCRACLLQASYSSCDPLRIGAQVQLVDCRIRFEHYPFTE